MNINKGLGTWSGREDDRHTICARGLDLGEILGCRWKYVDTRNHLGIALATFERFLSGPRDAGMGIEIIHRSRQGNAQESMTRVTC